MPHAIRFLARHEIDTTAWDTCVLASSQRIVYGYSWYLDAVLPDPDWRWAGLVLPNEAGDYQAVMPVPLRNKWGRWVVHQPFFCQYISIFSADSHLDTTPFFKVMWQRFRYGSTCSLSQQPADFIGFDLPRPLATLTLDLSAGYKALFDNYAPDRKRNLRRAKAANWTVITSTDLEPLLTLFRTNHADSIRGSVAPWAYGILRQAHQALQMRRLVTLRYALRHDRIEAGALFVQEGNRVIYLFNAASAIGRTGNARTLLIDQMICEQAIGTSTDQPLIFDFESPEKSSIANFYRSFGASEQEYWQVRWSRLNQLERWVLAMKKGINLG